MKRTYLLSLLAFFVISIQAQIKVEWGNTDTRYPVTTDSLIKIKRVSSATAWRGERVNFQLLV